MWSASTAAGGLVTVQAGMPLHRLNRLLEAAGLAMTNLGDIDQQTVAGALSTGTHGSGSAYGGLATQIRGLELVLADGSTLTCSATENPDVFAAARVGLGALGVVSTVTLAVEPLFALRAEEGPMPLDAVMSGFDELAESADHVEFYWFPHTRTTLVKRNTRLPLQAGLNPLPKWREWWDDEFLSNSVFGGLVSLGRQLPGVVRPAARVASRALGSQDVHRRLPPGLHLAATRPLPRDGVRRPARRPHPGPPAEWSTRSSARTCGSRSRSRSG